MIEFDKSMLWDKQFSTLKDRIILCSPILFEVIKNLLGGKTTAVNKMRVGIKSLANRGGGGPFAGWNRGDRISSVNESWTTSKRKQVNYNDVLAIVLWDCFNDVLDIVLWDCFN